MMSTLRQNSSKLLAEAIGTYLLVFAGCGAIVIDQVFQALGGETAGTR